jgi:hypothetical protein
MIHLLYILILFFISLFLFTFIFNIIFNCRKQYIDKDKKNIYRIILLTSQILSSIGILITFILILYNFTKLVDQLILFCCIIIYIILYILNIIGYTLIK